MVDCTIVVDGEEQETLVPNSGKSDCYLPRDGTISDEVSYDLYREHIYSGFRLGEFWFQSELDAFDVIEIPVYQYLDVNPEDEELHMNTLRKLFHTVNVDKWIPMESFSTPNMISLLPRWDHSRFMDRENLLDNTTYAPKEQQQKLYDFSQKIQNLSPELCRHGHNTVEHCLFCSGELDDGDGIWNWNGENLWFSSSDLFVMPWMTVSPNGTIDVLEGLFDDGIAIMPIGVFDSELTPLPMDGLRYVKASEGDLLCIDYLILKPNGTVHKLSRCALVHGTHDVEDVPIPKDAEAVFFLSEEDAYGSLIDMWEKMDDLGGVVGLLKDVSKTSLNLSKVPRKNDTSGLFLSGHSFSLSENLSVNGRQFGIIENARIIWDDSSGSIANGVSLTDNILSYTHTKALDNEMFSETKRSLDFGHLGFLDIANGIQSDNVFSVCGVCIKSNESAVTWSQGTSHGSFLHSLFLGTGSSDGIVIMDSDGEAVFDNCAIYGYQDGFSFSAPTTRQPRISLKNTVSIGNSNHGVALHGYGEGYFEMKQSELSWNGQGLSTADGKLWRLTIGSTHVNSNGPSSNNGGGLEIYGRLLLDDVSILRNHVTGNGGGLAIYTGASVNFEEGANETHICGNTADENGGGIYLADGADIETAFRMNIGHAFLNSSGNDGGFAYLGHTLEMPAPVFVGTFSPIKNTANGSGGALYLADGSVRLPSTFLIQGNQAQGKEQNVWSGGEYLIEVPNMVSPTSKCGITLPRKPTSLRMVGIAKTEDDSPITSAKQAFLLEGPMANNPLYIVGEGNMASTLVVRVRGTEGAEEDVHRVHVTFYGEGNRLVRTENAGPKSLSVLDTSNKKKPENGRGPGTIIPNDNPLRPIYLYEDGTVVRTPTLMELYNAYDYNIREGEAAWRFDRFGGNGYDAVEIWVQGPDGDETSVNKADWTVYPYSMDTEFTIGNVPGKIQIPDNGHMRIVAKSNQSDTSRWAKFYDYDISTGRIYANDTTAKSDGPNHTGGYDTTQRDSLASAYMYTYQSGINSLDNYHRTGTHYAFGNANAGSGWSLETWTDPNGKLNAINYANKTINGRPTVPGTWSNCVFGLVRGISNGELQWEDGITAPSLFDQEQIDDETGETTVFSPPAIGKTAYDHNEYSLAFHQDGYINVLTGVNGTNCKNLDSFFHPSPYEGKVWDTIWTNNFWPMDNAPSAGTSQHDILFGDYDNVKKYKFVGSNTSSPSLMTGDLPQADDGTDHNSYFGMRTGFQFQIPRGYVGPLEFLFFGDDDLWVFLDGELVCDIGGVHSSAGIYVNFWDYIEQGNTGRHKVEIFYTERGASGSTCWMQYTIPGILRDGDDIYKSIRISKDLGIGQSGVPDDGGKDYYFKLTAGQSIGTMIPYVGDYWMHDESHETENGVMGPVKAGQSVIVYNVPEGTLFRVEEWWPEGSLPDEFDQPLVRIRDGTADTTEWPSVWKIRADVDALVECTNFYLEPWIFDLEKTDSKTGAVMPNVSFQMKEIDHGTIVETNTYETDADGRFTITGQGKKEYLIEEIIPAGYELAGPWYLDINRTGDMELYTCKAEIGTDDTVQITKLDEVRLGFSDEAGFIFRCRNIKSKDPVYVLPGTGGGLIWWSLFGILALLLGGGMWYYRKRERM